MSEYNLIAKNKNSTVVAEYTPVKTQAIAYQSESALEKAFIKLLEEQAYEYLPITEEADLIRNLRTQLEQLNKYKFSETEWQDFFKNKIANPNEGIKEKTVKIQEDYIQILKRDDGESKNIYLIDRKFKSIIIIFKLLINMKQKEQD